MSDQRLGEGEAEAVILSRFINGLESTFKTGLVYRVSIISEIVKDLPKDYETMTEAQTNEFLAQAKPLCEETNGKPAQIEVAPGLEIKLSNVRYEEWRPGDNSIKVVIKADPDKSVADMRVLCLDKDNKIVFNNMLSNSTDTNHQFVSGWVAPDNAEKWGSVVRFVLVTGEIGNPLKTGDTYNQ